MIHEEKIRMVVSYCNRNKISLMVNYKVVIPALKQAISCAFEPYFPAGLITNCTFVGDSINETLQVSTN